MAQLSRVFTLALSTACWFFGQQAPPQAPPTFHSESEMEAMTATLKDSAATPSNAIRVLAVFSEGGAHVSDSDRGEMRFWFGPTTTTAQDAADQANALGILVYPVVLDLRDQVVSGCQGNFWL